MPQTLRLRIKEKMNKKNVIFNSRQAVLELLRVLYLLQ